MISIRSLNQSRFSIKHLAVYLLISQMGFLLTWNANACTSFALDTDSGLFFAHSLNQGSVESVAGSIYINPRLVWKNGHSFASLIDPSNRSGPDLVWQSSYGSVTFSPLGLEFPDGGMNEAGLFIYEMGYDSEYSEDDTLPVLFQMQWMQYQLDNFATVAEVLAHIDHVALDGWGWHYFVADKSGHSAVIDYENGKPVVYTDNDMPLPLCCNSKYPVAMDWLSKHQGFGGEIEIVQNFEEIPRFIYGAKLLQEYSNQDPVRYSFKMLDDMSVNVRWSVVFDVKNMVAYFKTNLNQDIRHFAFEPADFDPALGARRLDIETPGPTDIRGAFIPYDPAYDEGLLLGIIHYFIDESANKEAVVRSMVSKVQYSPEAQTLAGTWTGVMKVPAKGSWQDLPVTLKLRVEDGILAGSIDDQTFNFNQPLDNVTFKAGLLGFTTRVAESGDLVQYKLFVSHDKIRGGITTWDWDNRGKTAKLELGRGE